MRQPTASGASRHPLAAIVLSAALAACTATSSASPSATTSSPPSPAATPGLSPSPAATQPAKTSLSPGPSTGGVPGTWTGLDDMSEPRWDFTALELLDGRVFVIDQEPCNGMSDLSGPPWPPGPTDILDLGTGTWTPAAALNKTRSGFVAARLPDGRVLVTGGDNGWHGSYSSTELFDPDTGRWTAGELLNTARRDFAGIGLADGRVLVAGGVYSEGYEDEDDFLSGRSPDERELDSSEVYDPATSRWTKNGRLREGAAAGTAHLMPVGRVLVVGNIADGEPFPANEYDPTTGRWADAGSVALPWASASVVLEDGSLLVIGGLVEVTVGPDTYAFQPITKVVRFDPDGGRSSEAAPLPAPRADAVAVRLADGRILVAGGSGRELLPGGMSVAATDTTFLYDPERDAWTEAAPMPFADLPGRALLLSDGSVLVTGGGVPSPQPAIDVCGPDRPVGWTARYFPAEGG